MPEGDPSRPLENATQILRTSSKHESYPEKSATVTPEKKAVPRFTLPANLKWIQTNWTYSNIKPVIRCAFAAWISSILFVIPRVETFMGQASFLILIAAFLSPPSDPFMAVLEREVLVLLFVTVGWAWSCLGIKLANVARTNSVANADLALILTGAYIQAAPSVILAVFIFIGSAFFLYVKAKQGPGPFAAATVLGCICLDISLTTSALYPYPFYLIGKTIVLPVSLHSAISLVSSILLFPSSMSAQYTTCLQGVFNPLAKAINQHRALLKTPTDSDFFTFSPIADSVDNSEAALLPLAGSAHLLKGDLVYSRFAPSDLLSLQDFARKLAVRANGMTVYFTLIDPTRERFPVTPAPSRPPTPEATTLKGDEEGEPKTAQGTDHQPSRIVHRRYGVHSGIHPPHTHAHAHFHSHVRQREHHMHSPSQHTHGHDNLLHSSLLHLAMSRTPKSEQAVGVFESQRYLDLEATHMNQDAHTATTMALLQRSCDELLGQCGLTIEAVHVWLDQLRVGRFHFWVRARDKESALGQKMTGLERVKGELQQAVDRFRNDKRYIVLDPYRPAFDSRHLAFDGDAEIPPHRHLFHCYLYQYHLLQFALVLIEMLEKIVELEKKRKKTKLWTPAGTMLSWHFWEVSGQLEHADDENPEIIQGINPDRTDLGLPTRRDPDALPPSNRFEWAMNRINYGITAFWRGNTLFAVKAGLLTIVLCIPSFVKSSASFAFRNRFIWAIFIGQLTIARFRGDTTFGLLSRLMSTFLGGVAGIIMWYISCGSGRGNAIGLVAVCGVAFPFFFYVRLYMPGPPMTNIIFFVTTMLVVGYSYLDVHMPLPGSPGFGFDVAWRRFVLVTVGVVAAFIFSFFPPATTIRIYERRTLSTTSAEIGAIYCSIVSYVNSRTRREEEVHEIVTSLIAVRSKLKRSIVVRANVIYEFSMRGKWPAERYHKIVNLQLQMAYNLSHLLSVVTHLEPAWSFAFLRRTRLLDSDFQGDVLAVISMISTSLRTGDPLPQITPCPLLDRFMLRHHGLNVIHKESEDDYGLPRRLTIETLENEQYLTFSVGVTTAFGIIRLLDRLMHATKELVGERYHIHGVGLPTTSKSGGPSLETSTSSVQLPLAGSAQV